MKFLYMCNKINYMYNKYLNNVRTHKAFRYFYRNFDHIITTISHILTCFLCTTILIINAFDSMVHWFPGSKEKSVGPFHDWCTVSESVSSLLVLSFPDTLIDMLLMSMTSQNMHNFNNKLSFTALLLLLLVVVVVLTQYRAGDKIEKNEMGWACGAYGWGEGDV